MTSSACRAVSSTTRCSTVFECSRRRGLSAVERAADFVASARLIRRRYTILACLEDLGWLDTAVDSLVTGAGSWTAASMTPPPMQTSPS